jgi:putative phage-type endonuclease
VNINLFDQFDYRQRHYDRCLKIANDHLNDNEEETWHTRRLTGLGGSDIGTVLGLNPYQTIDELWRIKTSRASGFEGNAATHWGHILEDVVAQEFAAVTGRKVMRSGKHFISKELPFMVGNVDRFIMSPTPDGSFRRDAILECKTASQYNDKKFAKEVAWYCDGEFSKDVRCVTSPTDIPLSYYMQCQHYMYVTGIHKCYLAALIGGRDFRIYIINWSETDVRFMLRKAQEFWCWNVLDDKEPELTAKDLEKPMFEVSGETKVANSSDPIFRTMIDYKAICDQEEELKKEKEMLAARIEEYIASADTVLDCSGNKLATFKASGKTTVDREKMMKLNPELVAKYDELAAKCSYKKMNKKRTLRIY